MILLSQLIERFGAQLRRLYADRLLPGHERALDALRDCRRETSPVMVVQCPDCQSRQTLPHSCGHRSCPHCQPHESQQWLERQRAKLLPVDYFMVTFTLPRQLRSLVWCHQRRCYDLLLKLAWETRRQFGLNDRSLKGQIGATAVLHTHSRQLDYHPHVHLIVPAGALDPKHRLWRRKKGKYLFCQKSLAQVFRAKWLQALHEQGLNVSATLPGDWVVDCRQVGRGDRALTYLGKYLYRGVLQEKEILRCEHGRVTFRYTDNRGELKTRTLPGAEFLGLLLQHVLPKGFRRTRDYGFLHANSKRLIRLLQYVFHCPVPVADTPRERPPIHCPTGGSIMRIIATGIKPGPEPHPI